MTPTTNHSRATAHYTGLLDQIHGEQIMEALRELERAQADANKASVYCVDRDYEKCWFALKTAQIDFRRVVQNCGIDPDLIMEAIR